ncbi:MAG: hypothetical protein HY541_07855, partial [Deltaproteobacteria bacterium]|nr:hypothetical protein [Deltaproteobacteria bacterium]
MKVLFLLSLAALLVYSNTFSVPFHYDDQLNIVDNPQVHSLADFTDFLGSRSVGFLSFALNYAAGGLNVFGYHLVNLLIHVANGFLVYWLVVLLFQSVIPAKAGIQSLRPGMDSRFRGNDVFGRSGYVALTTALLFIVHPIQTQAVTYVVQRLASLMTLFYLLAVVCYLKWRLFGETTDQGPGTRDQKLQVTGLFKRSLVTGHRSLVTGHWSRVWYVASLLSTLLAMKTKENSFTLPFMILLVEWVFFRPVRKKQWMALIPFLLTLLIVPFSMGAAPGEEQFAQQTMSLSRTDYLFTQFRVIVTYLRLLVLPINQNVDYGYPAYHSLFEPTVFASFLLLLSLFTPAVYLLFRPKSGTAPVQGNVQSSTLNFELLTLNFPLRLVSFGILWFFITLSIE